MVKCILAMTLLLFLTMGVRAQPHSQTVPGLQEGREAILCSLQDAEGYWWYGGEGTGLCRFDGYDTEVFRSDRSHPHLLRSNDVLCLAEQRDSARIWFGTKEGAYILSKQDYSVRPVVLQDGTGNELADKRITCMMPEADGSVWMSYRNHLLHFSAEAVLLERYVTTWEGRNRSVLSCCFDADSTLWTGLWNGGVIAWRKEGSRRVPYNKSWRDYPDHSANSLAPQGQRQRLDSLMRSMAPASDAAVLAWAASPSGGFYIGTYHSLYYYDGETLSLLQGQLDKVRSMDYSAAHATLYLLSRSRGVCQWRDGQFEVLLDSTCFRELKLQGDSALLLSEGVGLPRLWHLKDQRLTIDSTTNDVHPRVTSCVIDGTRHLMPIGQQRLLLPRGCSQLEVHLSTLLFHHASEVQFAYRTDSREPWAVLPEGEHVLRLAGLPAGETLLEVRATDAYGRWSNPVKALVLVCPDSRYGCLGWGILTAVLLAAGGYLWARSRRKRVAEQEAMQVRKSENNVQNSPKETDGNIEPETEPSAGLSVTDREFLDKASASVFSHLSDTGYSVESLAEDLCMSRANLHRRMKAAAGMTPTDFIRGQRLERAAWLLRNTSHSVNEISDLVGFSYASYFTKCFKEKYGVLPKDF